jgi:hypothetical protein
MPIGANNPIVDKLIKKTVKHEEPVFKENHSDNSNTDIANNTHTENIANNTSTNANKNNTVSRARAKENATSNTIKMTFYIKQDLLDRLYNYAYWDRLSVTEAFNIAITDGLTNKNTKPKNR